MLIDSHAHLTDPRFDADGIIGDMSADGLENIITVAFDPESSRQCKAIAEAHDDVYFTVGVHPDDSQRLTSDPSDELLALAKSPKCVAIGEIGLDYHYDSTERDVQKKWFSRQLGIAAEADLPVVFHIRDAYEDSEKIVRENLSRLGRGGVVHCFSGSRETAGIFLDMGFYISFTGSITFKNAKKFAEIVRAVPLDRILVETDCPYLTPEPHRGETNYPKYVRAVAEKIAGYKGIEFSEVERATRENTRRLFYKMK